MSKFTLRFGRLAIASLVVFSSVFSALGFQKTDAVDHVNVFVGSGTGKIGYGGTMPFVTPPFGMTNWTAQTRQNKLGGVSYKYEDTSISGFIGTHQPAIWMGDYGYLTLIPEVGALKINPDERKMAFSHSDEIARPDYYSVSTSAGPAGQLQSKIRTELTATERCAYFRFTFPAGQDLKLVLEAARPGINGSATIDAVKQEIVGYNPDRTDSGLGPFKLPNFKGYFVVQFKRRFDGSGTYGPGQPIASDRTGAYVSFRTHEGEVLEVRVGTSFLSIEQARRNLEKEIPAWDFEAVQKKLRAAWNEKLDRVTLEGATPEQQTTVATALYHALLYPRVFSEDGRYYSAFDDTIHSGNSYTAYSIWDTFRAEHSLLTLVAPERVDGMITALLQNYKEGGWMPKWPNPSYTNIMIGTHADSMVAEAVDKHFSGFDRETAWQAVFKDAMTPPDEDTKHTWHDREPATPYEARGGLTYLKQLGYVPTDKTDEAASRTLEDSYDDWCVAKVAKALGKQKEYEFFLHRSLNYENIFNHKTGFMQGKKSDGSWGRRRRRLD